MRAGTRSRAITALCVASALAAWGAFQARAQVPSQVPTVPTLPPTTEPCASSEGCAPTSTSATTTTTPSNTSTTRPPLVTLPGESGPAPTSTTTTTQPPAPTEESPFEEVAPGPIAGVPGAADPGGGGGDGGALAAAGAFVIPPDWQAIINSVKRTRANNSAKLVDALSSLEDFGLSPEEALVVGMGRFPVAGYAVFSDDWLYFRAGPPPHLHQGTDIFAAVGTPIRAPFDGVVTYTTGGRLGGNAAYVTMADGTYVYNAHLSAFAPGLANGAMVSTGQIIGYVGDTGNALGGAAHDHFEIHPKGGPAVNPKPILDQWLVDALARVPDVVEWFRGRQPRIVTATGLTRRLAADEDMFAAPSRPWRGQLLWASSMSPLGGTLSLAQVEATRLAEEVDWERNARAVVAHNVAWQEAQRQVRALLDPLTPIALVRYRGYR